MKTFTLLLAACVATVALAQEVQRNRPPPRRVFDQPALNTLPGVEALLIQPTPAINFAAGVDFTIHAQDSADGGTNKSGGNLYLSSGAATGTGASAIYFQTPSAGASGTTRRNVGTRATLDAGGLGINGSRNVSDMLSVYGDIGIRANGGRLCFLDSGGAGSYIRSIGADDLSIRITGVEACTLTNVGGVRNLYVFGNGVFSGGTLSAGATNTGVWVLPAGALQTLVTNSTINPTSYAIRVVGSPGAITLTNTPEITTSGISDGTHLLVLGTSDSATVTLQDSRVATGSGLYMESGSLTLANGAAVEFRYSTNISRWKEITRSQNGSQTRQFANVLVDTNLTVNGLTASQAVLTDANKKLVSVATTGAGNVMRTRTGVCRSLWVGAGSMNPSASNGAVASTNFWATATDGQALDVMDFADASTLAAQGPCPLPITWDGGTIKVKVFWKTTAATTGDVVWSISAGALANGDTGGNTLGTAVTLTNTCANSTNKVTISSATAAITLGGTPAAGNLTWISAQRLGTDAADTFTDTARLIGCLVQYLENATEPSAW